MLPGCPSCLSGFTAFAGLVATQKRSCDGQNASERSHLTQPTPPPPPLLPRPESASVATPAAATEPQILSRRQQKKQVLRDAKLERKGQKKLLKQTGALEIALSTLQAAMGELVSDGLPGAGNDEALRTCLCRVFGAEGKYSELPHSHGPAPAQGLQVLGEILVRPPKYNAKFLPQEYSLLHKLWCLLEGDCSNAGVLDIGAGNANCAVLAAVLLGLTVICVERESPRQELRAEALLPEALQRRVVRLESDIADMDATTLREVAAVHGLQRVVLVAKHPCGIGVDRSIACAARLQTASAHGPQLLGAVLATCCTNKLSQDDLRASRVAEFCNLHANHLPFPSGIAGGRADTAGEAALQRAVEVMSRCSAWRSAAGSDGNAVQDGQLQWAELFEDCLQAPRLRLLGSIFGVSAEVRFAPRGCTLQDRCLLASSAPLPRALWTDCDGGMDEAFLKQIRASAAQLLEASGPIDCRPMGLKSERYGFDYTVMQAGT